MPPGTPDAVQGRIARTRSGHWDVVTVRRSAAAALLLAYVAVAARVGEPGRHERALFRAEYDAFRDDTPAAAVAATVRHVLGTGEHAVRVLRRRGVLPDSDGPALDVTVEDLLTVGNLVGREGDVS